MNWTDFHFIRPVWLLALLPLMTLLIGLWYNQKNDSQWQRWIDSSLLSHLLDSEQTKASRWPLLGLALIWLCATLAVAGPTWEKLPQPVMQKEQSLVVLWDMSPSMQARDLKPSRLVRARYKLIDLLKAKREGEAALVVYGGEAYVVTPLTDDMQTIINQLPALEPSLMPVSGSNTEMAVETALQLLRDSGVYAGDILLITDGVVPAAASTIEKLLANSQHRLSVMAVGTPAGAPIPFGDGFAKTDDGTVIIDKVATEPLQQLAEANRGRFSVLRSDNLDVQYLLQSGLGVSDPATFTSEEQNQQNFDQWLERGPLIALILLPFVALAFRRGWLLPCLFIALAGASFPPPAQALEWQDLWQTKDEQAYDLLQQGDAETAAKRFQDQRWSASAQYKNSQYEDAAKAFAGNSPIELYNKGNALAQAGKLDEALKAYDQALAQQPDFEDALHNKKVVEQLKDQQQQDQNQQGGDDQQQPKDQADQQQSNDSGEQENSQADGSEQEGSEQQQNAQNDGEQDGQSEQQANNEPSDGEQNQNEADGQEEPESSQQQANNGQGDQQEGSNPYENLEPGEPSDQPADDNSQQAMAAEGELSEEQQQALEQWLKQIPDDPSGLLRRKFQHQYRQRRQEYRTGQWELPSNNAASRL
ncbi:VWA domain-containing protein [Halioxenophilus aromaticivorans]|uniref:VWA domain-containing protein n=1 Tax=Halioxenophilus aromaticivorans TaxID=1306992 RepID=A0AAV3TYH3_9ALTE